MGQSTDGILVYGIQVSEEEKPEFLGEHDDFEYFVCAELGLPSHGDEGYDYKVIAAAVAEYPVTLVQHCSYEYPMYILAVNGTETTARRGYPQEIESLDVDQDRREALVAFAEKHGIDGEPKWLLCSMWG